MVFSGLTGRVLVVGEKVWRDLHQIPLRLSGGSNDNHVELLISTRILVPADLDELQVVVSENIAAEDDDSTLYQVIHPSSYCQLGCNYCGQVHSKGTMSPEVQRSLESQIAHKLEQQRYRHLTVSWFGGEPLLGLKAIQAISPRLLNLCKSLKKGYNARVVTNGLLLTNDVALELQDEHKVDFVEVTLDGDEASHDKRRHTKSQGGTFRAIFANLASIRNNADISFRLRIRCNVDRSNADAVPLLIEEMHRHGFHERFEFYVAPIHSWGNDAHLTSLDANEFAKLEVDWMTEMYDRGFRVSLLPQRKKIVCMAARRDATVTSADGKQYNCTEVAQVPVYEVSGLYNIGSTQAGASSNRRFPLQAFPAEVGDGKHQCSSCEILPVCGGSCPKQWADGVVPCPPIKRNLPQKLLLWHVIQQLERGKESGVAGAVEV